MPQRKHKPEEIVAKLRQVDVLLSQGRPVADAVRAISVTPFTYYRWRREFGGLKSDQVKRLKSLEKENERLRKAVSDLTLEKADPARGRLGKTYEPRPPSPLHRSRHDKARRVRAVGVPRAGAVSLDTKKVAEGARR